MLAIEPPRVGTTVLWLVEDILQHRSMDNTCYGRHDAPIEEKWELCLDSKRMAYNYGDIIESIQSNGFVRPLTSAWLDWLESWEFGDGHHRLAAAIDLGIEAVPVAIQAYAVVSSDSGDWSAGDEIPALN
jgi:hypothetical protein